MKKNKFNIKKRIGKILNMRRTDSIIAIAILAVLMSSMFFLSSGIVGLFLGTQDMISYSQEVDLTIDSSQEYTWNIEDHPELFNLKSVKLAGNYIGNGTAKIYLQDDQGRKYLVLDTSNFEQDDITSMTGYVVNVPEKEEPEEEPEKEKKSNKDEEPEEEEEEPEEQEKDKKEKKEKKEKKSDKEEEPEEEEVEEEHQQEGAETEEQEEVEEEQEQEEET